MENFAFSHTVASSSTTTAVRPFLSPLSISGARRSNNLSFPRSLTPSKHTVSAAKEQHHDESDDGTNKLNQWDLMELKFGQMLGEDPKLTLAKIIGKKVNPDASYLEIEKAFYKNKGKTVDVKVVPFDVPRRGRSLDKTKGLNLVRPVPRKGVKVGNDDEAKSMDEKRSGDSVDSRVQHLAKSSVPNVILRKPSIFNENDNDMENSSRLRIKPNLSLKMRTEAVKEKFGGMTLLKKPEPASSDEDVDKMQDGPRQIASVIEESSLMNETCTEVIDGISNDFVENLEKREQEQQVGETPNNVIMLEKPKLVVSNKTTHNSGGTSECNEMAIVKHHLERFSESIDDLSMTQQKLEVGSELGMQPLEHANLFSYDKENGVNDPPTEDAFQRKPRRLNLFLKDVPDPSGWNAVSGFPEGFGALRESGTSSVSSPLTEAEDVDWTRAEKLFESGDRAEVELISCSTRGFAASFGSLVGFLPYRNLAAKWKFFAFESWLRRKGLDPSKYRQKLGIIGNLEVPYGGAFVGSSLFPESRKDVKVEVTADMELDDIFRIYEQEKIQFLSSFAPQQIRVNVSLADRKSRKLIFSMRQKEKEETREKKRNIMAKLSVGDLVKCCIKKIAFFGIFVEIEGVPALIHQSEISWDVTVDPALHFKVGQTVEAKVHQLDFALERIYLSLKEITPDPLVEALECVVGDHSAVSRRLAEADADSEWADVDSLIKELQEIDGVDNVSKGRFFLSPGLAPTFQVYMASMFENQYKLLARSENKVQEVMVQASLNKEEMKSAIMACTNRVQ